MRTSVICIFYYMIKGQKTCSLIFFLFYCSGVLHNLNMNKIFYDASKDDIELVIHVDGLPLFRTSFMKFWPILGSVYRHPIFIIAIYKGFQDPQCAKTYLNDFLDEIIPYFSDGICVQRKVYNFHLRCILADAPARAFLPGLKRPTGCYSCSKCTKKGVRCENRTCFPILKDEQLTLR